jgi:hypothetical protein
MAKRGLLLLLACAPLFFTLACAKPGKVEQGRVIAYDKQNGVVTVIRDSSGGAEKPKNDVLPPIRVKIPQDRSEMGPLPDAGARLLFDTQARKVVFYDRASGTIKTLAYAPVGELANVAKDDPRVKGARFPIIDKEKKTVTLYSSRDKKLVTFGVTDEFLAMPVEIWKAGDDVRYFFETPGQALRMMNVTKTDVMKG